jgi:hypothetical protein
MHAMCMLKETVPVRVPMFRKRTVQELDVSGYELSKIGMNRLDGELEEVRL